MTQHIAYFNESSENQLKKLTYAAVGVVIDFFFLNMVTGHLSAIPTS